MDPFIDRADLLHIFTAETEENLHAMELGFVQLESAPGDADTLQAIFRAAHTIKGNAAGLGFTALAGFAHAVEDVLDGLRNGTQELTTPLASILLQAVDALQHIVASAVAGSDQLRPEDLQLLEEIRMEAGLARAESAPAHQGGGDRREGDRRSGGRRFADRHGTQRAQTLRVEIDKLDRMLNVAGEIAVARERLTALLQASDRARHEEILEAHWAADRLFMDLQEEVMKIRMVPLGPTFRQFSRVVRDAATAQGKSVALELAGEDVDVDMHVIEHLRDPLTHIVRNAIDHGIETPEARRAAGKDPRGRIALEAWRDGGSIVIRVQDDGAGLDRARIVDRARAIGYAADPEKVPEGELYRLILEPGFSTATAVTEFSGRGVGMDVVRRNVESLHGALSIESRAGAGTTFTIRLPLTLAIIRGFVVGVGAETYVVPLDAVIECLEFPRLGTAREAGRGVLNLRGQALPYLRLRDCFQVGGAALEREHVLVLRYRNERVGLIVDSLFGENQTVIKPLGRLLGDLPAVSGSAIMGNGHVALILEVEGLLREALRRDVPAAGVPVPPVPGERAQEGAAS